MTTKKKNTPSDPESKANPGGRAEMRAERVAELCSSLSLTESYNAIYRFRDSLDDALVAIDKFVSEAKRVSDELRQEGFDIPADFLNTWANEKTALTSAVFHKAAQVVVDVVFSALITGSPTHVRKLERILFERGPGRAEWVRLCSIYRGRLRDEPLPLSLLELPSEDYDPWLSKVLGDSRLRFAQSLVDLLTRIDGRAEALTPRKVVEAAEGHTRSDAGFAARLACMCSAFDYDWEAEVEKQPEDEKDRKKAQEDVQDRAQRAFTKAMREEAT
jgi:hypothetical protein